MNTREPTNIGSGRNRKSNRPSTSKLITTIALTSLLALAVVFGVQAVQISDQIGGGNVLDVPREYATIQEAIDAAQPGDMIEVRSGVYNENLLIDKPVTLIAKNFDEIDPVNNDTIIDGGGQQATITIPAGLTQMPTIRGFVIRNGTDNILAASKFVAEFNYIQAGQNLVTYQMGGGGFNRNNVYFGARDNALRLDNMNSPLTLENNRIMYSGAAGIEISLQAATAPPTVTEIGIWNNMILGNGEDGIQFVDHPGSPQNTNRRFVIAGNLIANNKMAGIGLMPDANTLENYSGASTAEAIRVYNNTFYGNDYGISGGGNLVAFNNIITRSLSRGTWRLESARAVNNLVAYTPEQDNSVIVYSLYFNNKLDADSTNMGTGVIIGVDPLFEAEPNAGPDGTWATMDDDFSGLVLRSDSPAIDRGITQLRANDGELIPPTPISGYIGAAPDLGWREFGAPIFPTPTETPLSAPTPLITQTVGTPSPAPTDPSASPSPEPATSTPGTGPTVTVIPPTETPTIAVTATTTPLTITSLAPLSTQSGTLVFMSISGTGFQSGTVVTFELNGVPVQQEALGTQVINDTLIILAFTPQNAGTEAQIWDVRVTNPNLTTFVLPDAFTVTPAP